MITKHAMRWYGPKDPVSLMDIRQSGATVVVSALHHLPVGTVWSQDDIAAYKNNIEKENSTFTPLHWEVVESLPVHEDIKKGLPNREKWIANYKESLKNLAACGIKTVCYNFMPVLDWSRTQTEYQMPDGGKALRFDWLEFAVFDLHILKRPEAQKAYSEELVIAAAELFATLSEEELTRISSNVLMGLPGSDDAFELETFQNLLDEYKLVGDQGLRDNLYYFLSQVAPYAESLGVKLAIHPDDPPFPLLGLPRIVSTEKDLEQILAASPVRANGLTFCTGSLGVREDNDVPAMAKRFADRIHFLHLRTTKRENTRFGSFHEAQHLAGNVNMYKVLSAIKAEHDKRKNDGLEDFQIPMRPDHGHAILDDLNKKTYPGYTAIGRLKGLAELRGIEYALINSEE
jgi:mannonate dehydratase